jgi:hypothetical protein
MQTIAGEQTMNAVWGGGNETTGSIFVTGGILVRRAWPGQIRRCLSRHALPPNAALECSNRTCSVMLIACNNGRGRQACDGTISGLEYED